VQQQPSRKWVKTLILAVSSLVFLGLSIIPLIGGVMQSQKAPPPPAANSAAAGDPNNAKALEETEKNYLALLQREANNEAALQGLVETRLQLIQSGQRKAQDVIDPLQKLVTLQPERMEYQMILAQAQQESGKMDEAVEAYQKVLAKAPTQPAALQGITRLFIQQQRAEDAIPILEKGLAAAQAANQKQSGSADTLALNLMLGDVYRAQKNITEASSLYERLIKESPNDFRPVATKGLLLKDQGKKEEALQQFQKALSLASADDKPRVQALIDGLQVPAVTSPSPSPSQ
jgi:tetratricopeptide (TPR) repeat protein